MSRFAIRNGSLTEVLYLLSLSYTRTVGERPYRRTEVLAKRSEHARIVANSEGWKIGGEHPHLDYAFIPRSQFSDYELDKVCDFVIPIHTLTEVLKVFPKNKTVYIDVKEDLVTFRVGKFVYLVRPISIEVRAPSDTYKIIKKIIDSSEATVRIPIDTLLKAIKERQGDLIYFYISPDRSYIFNKVTQYDIELLSMNESVTPLIMLVDADGFNGLDKASVDFVTLHIGKIEGNVYPLVLEVSDSYTLYRKFAGERLSKEEFDEVLSEARKTEEREAELEMFVNETIAPIEEALKSIEFDVKKLKNLLANYERNKWNLDWIQSEDFDETLEEIRNLAKKLEDFLENAYTRELLDKFIEVEASLRGVTRGKLGELKRRISAVRNKFVEIKNLISEANGVVEDGEVKKKLLERFNDLCELVLEAEKIRRFESKISTPGGVTNLISDLETKHLEGFWFDVSHSSGAYYVARALLYILEHPTITRDELLRWYTDLDKLFHKKFIDALISASKALAMAERKETTLPKEIGEKLRSYEEELKRISIECDNIDKRLLSLLGPIEGKRIRGERLTIDEVEKTLSELRKYDETLKKLYDEFSNVQKSVKDLESIAGRTSKYQYLVKLCNDVKKSLDWVTKKIKRDSDTLTKILKELREKETEITKPKAEERKSEKPEVKVERLEKELEEREKELEERERKLSEWEKRLKKLLSESCANKLRFYVRSRLIDMGLSIGDVTSIAKDLDSTIVDLARKVTNEEITQEEAERELDRLIEEKLKEREKKEVKAEEVPPKFRERGRIRKELEYAYISYLKRHGVTNYRQCLDYVKDDIEALVDEVVKGRLSLDEAIERVERLGIPEIATIKRAPPTPIGVGAPTEVPEAAYLTAGQAVDVIWNNYLPQLLNFGLRYVFENYGRDIGIFERDLGTIARRLASRLRLVGEEMRAKGEAESKGRLIWAGQGLIRYAYDIVWNGIVSGMRRVTADIWPQLRLFPSVTKALSETGLTNPEVRALAGVVFKYLGIPKEYWTEDVIKCYDKLVSVAGEDP